LPWESHGTGLVVSVIFEAVYMCRQALAMKTKRNKHAQMLLATWCTQVTIS
jgi:hypothetical protein